MKNPHSNATIISLDFNKNGRVREVVKRSNLRATGKFSSRKNKASVHWESSIELDLFFLLDTITEDATFQEQPFTIIYEVNGQRHRHTPDVLLLFRGRKIVYEVKAADDINLCDAYKRAHTLKADLGTLGYEYHVVTDTVIRQEPWLQNAKQLHFWSRSSVSAEEERRMSKRVSEVPTTTLETLTEVDLEEVRLPFIAARMIMDGVLSFDKSLPIFSAPLSLSSHRNACVIGEWPWQ